MSFTATFSRAVRQVFRDILRVDERLSVNVFKSQGQGQGETSKQICSTRPITGTANQSVIQSWAKPAVQLFSRFFLSNSVVKLSVASTLKRHAVQRLIAHRGSAPVFAFLGFAYAGGISHDYQNGPAKPSLENLFNYFQSDFQQKRDIKSSVRDSVINVEKKLNDFDIKERLGKASSCAAVYAAEDKLNKDAVAIKIMYNYEHSSNSMALKQGFEKEFQVLASPDVTQDNVEGEENSTISIPRHPNIIRLHQVFTDDTPCLYDSKTTYPAALPTRYDRNGMGRNRTLCLVMPKYDCTLREYLNDVQDQLPVKESVMLLAQLLEGITHLVTHNVAHRDLKADNILLNNRANGRAKLVITDFGCCLAERNYGLYLPFQTSYMDRGGNSVLMAPEIACATPGPRKLLDYSKSDVWAAGAIGYEIFGHLNPFGCRRLDSRFYADEDLPPLENCPLGLIEEILHIILRRDPQERPSSSEAATLVELLLFAPASWLLRTEVETLPDQKVHRWLIELCIRSLQEEQEALRTGNETQVETELLRSFVSRTSVEEIISALHYLHG